MRLKVLSLVAALLLIGGVTPSAASAQCYSPGYGPGYYYPNYHGHPYYRYHPSYRQQLYFPSFHGHGYYRRRCW